MSGSVTTTFFARSFGVFIEWRLVFSAGYCVGEPRSCASMPRLIAEDATSSGVDPGRDGSRSAILRPKSRACLMKRCIWQPSTKRISAHATKD